MLATIFGLVTSLVFGATQAASGLAYLFDIPNTIGTHQLAIIVVITVIALFSVWRGIDGGVAAVCGRGGANPDDSDGNWHHGAGLRKPPAAAVELDWAR